MKKVSEVATQLGVTRNTVYKRIQQLSPAIQNHVFVKDKTKHIDSTGIRMIAEALGISFEITKDTEPNTVDDKVNSTDTIRDTPWNETIVITATEQEQIQGRIRLQEQIIEDLRRQLEQKSHEQDFRLSHQEAMYRELINDKDKQIERMEKEVENKNQQFVNFQVLLKQANERTSLLEHQLEKVDERETKQSFWGRFFGTSKTIQDNQE